MWIMDTIHMKNLAMTKKRNPNLRFVVCVDNSGYEASIEFGKLYQVVPDAEAAKHGYMTIVDESGEGYWYSAQRLFPVEVPAKLT